MNATRRTFVSAAALPTLGAAPQARRDVSAPESRRFREAIASGDLAAVSVLLNRDPALAWSRDEHGISVYILAMLKRQKPVAELLVSKGLVLDIFEAAAGGQLPRVQELAKTSPGIVNLRTPDGRTPLHFAAEAGQTEMVFFLNGAGADLSAGPESPLIDAVSSPDAQAAASMSQILLINHSDPNARRKDGSTALHLAAAQGYGGTVRLLIHRGADPEALDGNGRTPLETATGNAIAVLRGAASIDRAYYGRRFPRPEEPSEVPQSFINQFVGLAHNNAERVKQLLRLCPALLQTRATWDETAVEAAAHMGLTPLASYLAEAGAAVSTCTAALLGQTSRVRANLKEEPRCLYERGAHDLPLLAYTAFGEPRMEIAELLLATGSDVHVRGFGQTTLHFAAARGHVDLARLLLDCGADVNAVTETKEPATPLAMAVRAQRQAVADLLRSRGGRA